MKKAFRDARYDTIKVLIDAGHIKTITDIFVFIPKTVVYRDFGANFIRFDIAITDPSRFRLGELMLLAEMFSVDAKVIIDMAYQQSLSIEKISEDKFSIMTNANEHFGSGNGSENFYQHNLPPFVYTDGVKDMAETCGAYWLIDLVISHQFSRKVQSQLFQIWELKRVKDNAFRVKATDGNENQIACQQIPFSDFRFDMATLWLVDGCLMLPKEY